MNIIEFMKDTRNSEVISRIGVDNSIWDISESVEQDFDGGVKFIFKPEADAGQIARININTMTGGSYEKAEIFFIGSERKQMGTMFAGEYDWS